MGQEDNYIIYKAVNSVSNKVYIGATTSSVEARKSAHITKAINGDKTKFYEAISTYGTEAFNWEQIDTASSTDELAQKEKQYIFEYKAKDEGYNSDEGGGFKKTVYQYDLSDGSLLNSYDSLTDAGNAVNATKQQISSACLSVNNIFKGFYWSYMYTEPFSPTKDKRIKNVMQLNLKGELLTEYKSVAEASRETGVNKTCIAKVCRGEKHSSGGYCWNYK